MKKYVISDSIMFKKNTDEFGCFSNMSRFTVEYKGLWRTSEALYQACRFPQYPELREEIRLAVSPMTAKKIAHSHVKLSRPDWLDFRIKGMKFCLNLKFNQHREYLTAMLLRTENRSIVENSSRDTFWGAIPNNGIAIGNNWLGTLWMNIRASL